MVEMAVVLPIFIAVVFGIVEFGQAFMVLQLVNNAAREGGRIAIVNGSSNTEATQAVLDTLAESAKIDPTDVTVTITVTPESGNPDPGNEVANANKRDLCTVAVSVPFSAVALVSGEFLMSVPLKGQSSMRHE